MSKFKTTMNGAPELQGECGTATFDGDELFVCSCDEGIHAAEMQHGHCYFQWEDLLELRKRSEEYKSRR